MAALIYVFTAFLHVPSATGYTHVGDGFLYLAGCILPAPFAAAAGAIGAGLSDILSGYTAWAPWTIVIKALTGLCFSCKGNKRRIIAAHHGYAIARNRGNELGEFAPDFA